jgi:alpha-beta hydrolase superfamily lysophospholipase
MRWLTGLYHRALRWGGRLLLLVAVIAVTLLIGRAIQSQSGPPLEPWHTFVPDEPDAQAIDRLDWDGYLAAETRTFASVRAQVTERLEEKDRRPDDRYFAGSLVYPGAFASDWNRSYVLEPAGRPVGAVVLLHGLTDSPYSLRHVAEFYRAHGYLAIGLRMPGHGTVPAALTSTTWEDWLAATRLAVREAHRRVSPGAPLHLIGYSAGGAAAVKYALDALEDPGLPRPDRLVLISPMIGVSTFARFAGLAALPALLPPFAKAAWLTIVPEFNPFKYNSFPVNAARQAHRLTVAIQRQLDRLSASGRLRGLAPILTFQSSVDFTVNARAVVESLYARLPANGSELVLFDINHNTKFGPLLRAVFASATERIVPPPPRDWQLTIVANTQDDPEVKERTTVAGATVETVRGLGLAYPRDIFSLSHVALPFPIDDSLYGAQPEPSENFGVALGSLAAHGEVGVLIVSFDTLARLTWNPFFSYMLARIGEGMGGASTR